MSVWKLILQVCSFVDSFANIVNKLVVRQLSILITDKFSIADHSGMSPTNFRSWNCKDINAANLPEMSQKNRWTHEGEKWLKMTTMKMNSDSPLALTLTPLSLTIPSSDSLNVAVEFENVYNCWTTSSLKCSSVYL